ncbi:MAG TPA: PrsW family glutamic-type intramembrane protease [Bacteroidota bacterium]|nr:PrsW family glutamic-type intramembrane protease [Bacteroidota bacterium]
MLSGLISLLPVFAFLAALVFLDSYKLVNFRSILLTILVGCAMTIPPFLFSGVALGVLHISSSIYSLYGGPIVEELFKALYMVHLMKQKRVGFGVDAAIYGFSIGAGFSLIENIYYLESLPGQHILLWVARGLGTAVMHGGTTAIFALITKSLSDRFGGLKVRTMIPGLAAAIVMHSFYNHFLLSPLLPTAFLLALFPVIFWQSEKTTRKWLGVGLDTDLQLLDIITSGDIAQTKIGDYFQTLQKQFRGEIIVDMICLVRLHTELAIRAKGVLMMRSGGFNPPSGPELPEKFAELKYLQKSIGKTGQLALAPLLHMSSRDLWQIHMLRG